MTGNLSLQPQCCHYMSEMYPAGYGEKAEQDRSIHLSKEKRWAWGKTPEPGGSMVSRAALREAAVRSSVPVPGCECPHGPAELTTKLSVLSGCAKVDSACFYCDRCTGYRALTTSPERPN